ncbi:MAG: post-COAP-1 domain-containing protein [Nitrososphaerales archaeon]
MTNLKLGIPILMVSLLAPLLVLGNMNFTMAWVTPSPGEANGGGWFLDNNHKNNFGFDVAVIEPPADGLVNALDCIGDFQYVDRDARYRFHGIVGNCGFVEDTSPQVVFGGNGILNRDVSCEFLVTAVDAGEPGTNDNISVNIFNCASSFNDFSFGTLGGGNIDVFIFNNFD